MTSSGTYAWTLTNGEAILAAFDRIGMEATELKQRHMIVARREINLLLSEWSNKQVNLFEVKLFSVSLVQGTATYVLPSQVVMMLDCYRSTTTNGVTTDNFMTAMTRDQYAAYPVKSTQSPPTMFYFDRQITPQVTLYPVPDGNGPYTLNYYACVQMQDANIPGGETPDIPYRWYDAFVAGLAHRLSRPFAPTLEQMRDKDAKEAWAAAAGQDTQNAPITLTLNVGAYYPR